MISSHEATDDQLTTSDSDRAALVAGRGEAEAPASRGHRRVETTAVLTAYGFNAKTDLLAQLLALYQQVAAKIEKGEPVTAPGVPKNYPDSKKLVTEDCTKP